MGSFKDLIRISLDGHHDGTNYAARSSRRIGKMILADSIIEPYAGLCCCEFRAVGKE